MPRYLITTTTTLNELHKILAPTEETARQIAVDNAGSVIRGARAWHRGDPELHPHATSWSPYHYGLTPATVVKVVDRTRPSEGTVDHLALALELLTQPGGPSPDMIKSAVACLKAHLRGGAG